MLIEEIVLSVMLAAQMRLGKATCRSFPLESMLSEEVMLETCVLNCVNLLLLLISRLMTVSKLIPSRLLRKVLVIRT